MYFDTPPYCDLRLHLTCFLLVCVYFVNNNVEKHCGWRYNLDFVFITLSTNFMQRN